MTQSGSDRSGDQHHQPDHAGIRAMLQPRSIAVIGASTVHDSFGERATRHFDRIGYAGQVYFVNPRYEEIRGRRCYPSIESLPGDVDTAVILLNARAVTPALHELARTNCRGAVVLGSGFGELGAGGDHLQVELLETARRFGIRLIGPNTNGVVNVVDHVPLGFTSVLERPVLRPGGLAVIGQSGSITASFADAAMDSGSGVSYVLAIGNAIDLGVNELLRFLATDALTTTAFVFIEGLRDPDGFFEALSLFRAAGKIAILLKVGRSVEGRTLAATHSGSIAGSWDAFRELAEDRGALVATSLDEALDLCTVATRGRLPVKSPRVGVVTASGAVSGLFADEASAAGVPIARLLDPAIIGELEAMGFRAPFNPVDFGQALPGSPKKPDFRRICELMLQSEDVDVFLFATALTHYLPHMGEVLAELKKTAHKPMYSFVFGSAIAQPCINTLRAADIPVFARLPNLISALGRATSSLPVEARTAAAVQDRADDADLANGSGLLEAAAASPSEYRLAAWLESAGLCYPARQLAGSADQAVAAARVLQYPVALKVVGSKVLHKSAAGLLRLPLQSDAEVRRAWDDCSAAARALGLWEGEVMMQSLVDLRGGIELIVAVRRDIEVGPMLMVGLGGAIAEAVGSASIAPLPSGTADVERLLARSPVLNKLFNTGQRGLDRDALVTALVALGRVARPALEKFSAVEINPLVVLPAGRGCWALDAAAVREGS